MIETIIKKVYANAGLGTLNLFFTLGVLFIVCGLALNNKIFFFAGFITWIIGCVALVIFSKPKTEIKTSLELTEEINHEGNEDEDGNESMQGDNTEGIEERKSLLS